jgi:hypothetical protein
VNAEAYRPTAMLDHDPGITQLNYGVVHPVLYARTTRCAVNHSCLRGDRKASWDYDETAGGMARRHWFRRHESHQHGRRQRSANPDQEEAAHELASSPHMEPYLNFTMALMQGADPHTGTGSHSAIACRFFATGDYAFAASALFNARRFFVAAMIALRPAAESFRLGLGASGCEGSAAFLDAAHLLRCASAIAFLPAALIFRRLRFGGSGVAAGSVGSTS